MRRKVLIVDDDVNFRYAVRELIPWRDYGFEVVNEAIHGKQALEFLEQEPVSVVMTDMEMPIMDGVELTKCIKMRYPDIIVVAMSAYDDFSFVKESMRLGAADYILKQDFEPRKAAELIANYCREKEALDRTETSRMEPETADKHGDMKKADEYIERHYHHDISLSGLSEYMGLSENYFSTLFKKEMGVSLKTYVNTVRIEKAKQLLKETNLKIYEVAEQVGYNNSTYFSTLFKKVTGRSVSEYRNRSIS